MLHLRAHHAYRITHGHHTHDRWSGCIRRLTRYARYQRDAKTSSTSKAILNLAEKRAVIAKQDERRVAGLQAHAKRLQRRSEDKDSPRASPSAYNPHHDLTSFLDYVEQHNLKASTTVFKGTLYEYTVAEALKALSMSLKRVGKSDDRGVDLIGYWVLPDDPPSMRMLVQCKMTKPTPALIRELEGSYVGAPAGWNGDNVFAVLASRHVATPGTQQAIQRSKLPLGFIQIDFDGHVRQFIWNQAAAEGGLSGVGVTSKFELESDKSGGQSKIEPSIALTWMGQQWPVASI